MRTGTKVPSAYSGQLWGFPLFFLFTAHLSFGSLSFSFVFSFFFSFFLFLYFKKENKFFFKKNLARFFALKEYGFTQKEEKKLKKKKKSKKKRRQKSWTFTTEEQEGF